MTAAKVPAEAIRRFLNVGEALLIVSLIGLGTIVMSTRDLVVTQTVTSAEVQKTLEKMQAKLDAVPALTERVSRNEAKNEEQDRRLDRLERQNGAAR